MNPGSGNFVVSWTDANGFDGSGNQANDDGDGVSARIYSANGSPQSTQEFVVNETRIGEQAKPSVAMDRVDGFVVTWVAGDGGGDGNSDAVMARRFAANGSPLDGEFLVNDYFPGSQAVPKIAMDKHGNFVIVWEDGEPGRDGSQDGLYARRFDNNGDALSASFLVNTRTANFQNDQAISMNEDGAFVIVWESYGAQDGDGSGIFFQRYNAAGNPLGLETQANTLTAGNQQEPAVLLDATGNFLLAWEQPTPGGRDISARGFLGPAVNPGGPTTGADLDALIAASKSKGGGALAWMTLLFGSAAALLRRRRR
jgi:hypothetical protein